MSAIRLSGQPGLQRRTIGRDVLIVTALCFAALAFAVGLRMAGGATPSRISEPLPTTVPAFVPDLPQAGAVFHLRERVFARHGAAAAEIASWRTPSTLPETYVRESWALVDAHSRLLELVSETRAEDGRLLQRSRTTASESWVEDVATGDIRRLPRTNLPHIVVPPDVLAEQGWNHYDALRDAGTIGFVRTHRLGGETLVIFLERLPLPPAARGTIETSDGAVRPLTEATVPYVADLHLQVLQREVTFNDTTHRPLSQQTVAILSDGSRVVIESTHWLVQEVLPASLWSDLVAEGRD